MKIIIIKLYEKKKQMTKRKQVKTQRNVAHVSQRFLSLVLVAPFMHYYYCFFSLLLSKPLFLHIIYLCLFFFDVTIFIAFNKYKHGCHHFSCNLTLPLLTHYNFIIIIIIIAWLLSELNYKKYLVIYLLISLVNL